MPAAYRRTGSHMLLACRPNPSRKPAAKEEVGNVQPAFARVVFLARARLGSLPIKDTTTPMT